MIIWGFSIQIWPEYHFYSSFPPLDEFAFLFFPGLSRSISLKRQETGNRKQRGGHSQCWLLFFFFFWSFTWVRLSNSTQTEQRPSAARTETDGRNILTSVFRVSRFHRGRSEVKPINNRNLWPGNEVWLNPLPVKTKTDVRLTTKWRRTSAVLWFWILVLIFLYLSRQQLCLIAFCTPGAKQPLIKVQIQNQQEFEDQHCDPQC